MVKNLVHVLDDLNYSIRYGPPGPPKSGAPDKIPRPGGFISPGQGVFLAC